MKQITESYNEINQTLSKRLINLEHEVNHLAAYEICGKVISALGTTVTAYLPNAKIGDLCIIFDELIKLELYAEVVAINNNQVKLLPLGNIENISQNCQVKKLKNSFSIAVGEHLLGNILNGFGEITGRIVTYDSGIIADTQTVTRMSIMSLAPDPLSRPLIEEKIITGVTAIDLFNTCGLGQRVGIFAGPGMGKTTLMGMMARSSRVDVVVVALIGERGREVREFIDLELNEEIRSKCVLVVATSDRPPVEQVKCAYVAQTVAEYFRDQGKNVLLFVDSITRFARAQREVGLSAGEPIARGGYPPSVFLSFPRLMERAGKNQYGSITAFYTVLMEGEELNADPIADEVKSIIDGHIVLSRKLAERGHFPAVNILASLSRVADRIIDDKHLKAARHLRLLLSKFEELEFLIRVGEYRPGQDQLADEAVNKHDSIMHYLRQTQHETFDFSSRLRELFNLAR